MNRFTLTSVVCGGMISLAGSALLAQESSANPNASSTLPSSSATGQNATSPTDPSSTSTSSSTGEHWRHGGNSVRLSHLLNSTVQTRDGKSVGSIRDFTLDPQSGHIQFALVSPEATTAGSGSSFSGSSVSGRQTVPSSTSSSGTASTTTTPGAIGTSGNYGATGKVIPIPWQLFSQSWSGTRMSSSTTTPGTAATHNLTLNIDESKLQGAPTVDATDMSQLQQPTFEQQVYAYFGVDRMSGAGTSGSSISGQGTGTRETEGGTYPKNKGGSSDLQQK